MVSNQYLGDDRIVHEPLDVPKASSRRIYSDSEASDDIVTRLREECESLKVDVQVLREAADEIERLREKIQDLRMHAEQDACEIERLRAEVARLGSFLHPIGMVIDGQFSSTSETAWKRDD